MDNNNTKVTTNGGIGFVGLLQVAFIVLKLCGVIDWSWWVVWLPMMISTGIGLLVLIIFFIIWYKLS